MAAAVAVGQQLVLNKSAFLSVQRLLKHVSVCVSESVRERHREKERGRAYDSPTVSLRDCLCSCMCPFNAFLVAFNIIEPGNDGKNTI